MAEMKDGCVKPARGPMPLAAGPVKAGSATSVVLEGGTMLEVMKARVGEPAPDFEANAFLAGTGFKTVQLSEYKGRWIVLCFYPGDFTFV